MDLSECSNVCEGPAFFASILPTNIYSAQSLADFASEIHPAEEEYIRASWDANRKREFRCGRVCANRALAALGCREHPVLRGPGNAPVWPSGTIGSITHSEGYCAAIAARSEDFSNIGLDVDMNTSLPDGVLDLIASRWEREQLTAAHGASDGSLSYDKALFCIKESIYKAWYPLTFEWLDFCDVVVSLQDSGFTARILRSRRRMEGYNVMMHGSFLAGRDLIAAYTSITR